MAVIIALIAGIVSLIGIGVVKEGKHMDESREEKITFKEIASLFVGNKPFLINTVMTIFHGFVWTMVFATTTYYIKWAYCTDLSTGVVDQAAFGKGAVIDTDRLGVLGAAAGESYGEQAGRQDARQQFFHRS